METNGRKQISPELKFKIVVESFQRDMTIESVRRRYNVSKSAINRWRGQFKGDGPKIFANGKSKREGQGELVDEPKRIIGELTVQLEIIKKHRACLFNC